MEIPSSILFRSATLTSLKKPVKVLPKKEVPDGIPPHNCSVGAQSLNTSHLLKLNRVLPETRRTRILSARPNHELTESPFSSFVADRNLPNTHDFAKRVVSIYSKRLKNPETIAHPLVRKFLEMYKSEGGKLEIPVHLLSALSPNACFEHRNQEIFVHVGLFEDTLKDYGESRNADLLMSEIPWTLAHEIGHSIVKQVLGLDGSRKLHNISMEDLCDLIGLVLAHESGFDIRHVGFSRYIEDEDKEGRGVPYIDTHPGHIERNERLKRLEQTAIYTQIQTSNSLASSGTEIAGSIYSELNEEHKYSFEKRPHDRRTADEQRRIEVVISDASGLVEKIEDKLNEISEYDVQQKDYESWELSETKELLSSTIQFQKHKESLIELITSIVNSGYEDYREDVEDMLDPVVDNLTETLNEWIVQSTYRLARQDQKLQDMLKNINKELKYFKEISDKQSHATSQELLELKNRLENMDLSNLASELSRVIEKVESSKKTQDDIRDENVATVYQLSKAISEQVIDPGDFSDFEKAFLNQVFLRNLSRQIPFYIRDDCEKPSLYLEEQELRPSSLEDIYNLVSKLPSRYELDYKGEKVRIIKSISVTLEEALKQVPDFDLEQESEMVFDIAALLSFNGYPVDLSLVTKSKNYHEIFAQKINQSVKEGDFAKLNAVFSYFDQGLEQISTHISPESIETLFNNNQIDILRSLRSGFNFNQLTKLFNSYKNFDIVLFKELHKKRDEIDPQWIESNQDQIIQKIESIPLENVKERYSAYVLYGDMLQQSWALRPYDAKVNYLKDLQGLSEITKGNFRFDPGEFQKRQGKIPLCLIAPSPLIEWINGFQSFEELNAIAPYINIGFGANRPKYDLVTKKAQAVVSASPLTSGWGLSFENTGNLTSDNKLDTFDPWLLEKAGGLDLEVDYNLNRIPSFEWIQRELEPDLNPLFEEMGKAVQSARKEYFGKLLEIYKAIVASSPAKNQIALLHKFLALSYPKLTSNLVKSLAPILEHSRGARVQVSKEELSPPLSEAISFGLSHDPFSLQKLNEVQQVPARDYLYLLYFNQEYKNTGEKTIEQLIQNADVDKCFGFITNIMDSPSPYRDVVLNRTFYPEKFENASAKQQKKILDLFYTPAKSARLRGIYLQQRLDEVNGVDGKIAIVQEVMPRPSNDRDRILQKILLENPISLNDLVTKYAESFSSLNFEFQRDENTIEHIFGAVIETKMTHEEQVKLLTWLCQKSDEKPLRIMMLEGELAVNLEELRLVFLHSEDVQNKVLDAVLTGPNGLLRSQEKLNSFIDNCIGEYLKVDADPPIKKEDKVKVLLRKAIDLILEKSQNDTKKIKIIKNLIKSITQRGSSSVESLVANVLKAYGSAGVKFGQLISTQPALKERWPTLQRELSELKEDKGDSFDLFELSQAVNTVPTLRGKEIIVDEVLPSGSMKKVAKVRIPELFGQEQLIAKYIKMGASYQLDKESQELKDILEDLKPWLKELFGVERIPQSAYEVFDDIKLEVDTTVEAANNQRTRDLLRDFQLQNADPTVQITSPQVESSYFNQVFMLERVAPGCSLKDIDESPGTAPVKLSSQEREKVTSDLKKATKFLLSKGFFHADPHSGQIFVHKDEDGKITINLIDLGICDELPEQARNYASLLLDPQFHELIKSLTPEEIQSLQKLGEDKRRTKVRGFITAGASLLSQPQLLRKYQQLQTLLQSHNLENQQIQSLIENIGVPLIRDIVNSCKGRDVKDMPAIIFNKIDTAEHIDRPKYVSRLLFAIIKSMDWSMQPAMSS
ncbi:MAG: AarF/UbiB family protein [Candidatus Caenarcaniphilales bacterium]|nr:AarF/UbiB family protein [Candidatus Caenarcaniphilales bacterium]